MNKLTKVGFSALCGSLAAISTANAGDLTVTGGVDMTWISLHDQVTGNPLGIGSNLTFKGSGELDNGWTFDLTVANANANAFSAAKVDIGMGGLGNIMVNQGDGNGLGSYDDKMPTAWEESWGNGLSTGVKLVAGVGSSNNIQYTSPTILGTTIVLAYAPEMGAADTADKASSGAASNTVGKGYDGIININPSLGTELLSGLNIYAGGHITEKTQNNGTLNNDKGEVVGGITYDIGPVSLGAGWGGFVTGYEAHASYNDYYKNRMYGVSFNINDDLSVSHSFYKTRKEGFRSSAWLRENLRTVEVETYQIAYTMGGASIRLATTEGNNLNFSAGNDKDATVLSVGLAF